MLVLIGPTFAGNDEAYQRLARVTGMLLYDLKARVKTGSWGLVRALADAAEAERLGAALTAEGFPVALVGPEVAADQARPFVALAGLAVSESGLTLELRERTMAVPLAALCCLVRAEVQVGKAAARSHAAAGASSSTFRAVVPSASDLQVFRETVTSGSFEAFAAADLHFHSVNWIARIDARSFDFTALGIGAPSQVAALDVLVDRLAALAKVRVDRAARSSSIVSFAQQAWSRHRENTTPHGTTRGRELAGDERFDPYSRIVGEAERTFARGLASAAAAAG